MKIYGIIRTVWNGSSYYSDPYEDILLYLSEDERDKGMAQYVNDGDVYQYNTFETETKE
ncbi:hypothetical protein AAAZ42_20020 [Bacteroides ovatus]|jgi:hypothetical protein|uniref:hypothetical protein n=1 Tax=Bacteroides ovatus TaxID=28116 RepID=UPI002481910E|nr:hypothetical protein [Bacteroides ovatus]MDC2381307.1 hypothetical protein [Bacteroides ovatus]